MHKESNDNRDLILGRLEAFQEYSRNEFDSVHEELKMIRVDMVALNKARWIFYGQSAALYSFLVMVVEFILHKTVFSGG